MTRTTKRQANPLILANHIGWLALCLLAACAVDGARADPAVCTDGDEHNQRHGSTCLCCHSELGVAGSIDPAGPLVATIVVTDSRGEVATMSPNSFDNFFRHFALEPPLEARVIGPTGVESRMQSRAPTGDCNACHATGGQAPPIHGP